MYETKTSGCKSNFTFIYMSREWVLKLILGNIPKYEKSYCSCFEFVKECKHDNNKYAFPKVR